MVAKWKTEHRCKFCSHTLTNSDRMYSGGRCPYCGEKGMLACTIVDSTEHAYYTVKTGRIWEFWKTKRVYK